MQYFEIVGGNRLRGLVPISGAKNAALPIMAASILVEGETILHNVPDLADVRQLQVLLGRLGVKSERAEDGAMHLRVEDEMNTHAEYELVSKMRASVCVMGPLLAKRKRAQVSMPGGCAIGDRPIDLHIQGLRALGADFDFVNGDVLLRVKKLTGSEIFLGGPFGASVTATANVMMAATLADGKTIIESAACEPEIVDLATYLNACGARIAGQGTPQLRIEGVASLTGAEHRVIPDRIGRQVDDLRLTGCAIGDRPIDLHIQGLRALGADFDFVNGDVLLRVKKLTGSEIFLGGPFGASVTATANVMMAATLADGKTIIESAACEPEIVDLATYLNACGARIAGQGTPQLRIEGVASLTGAEHRVIPDRIEVGTFMIAAALTNGDLELEGARIEHIGAIVDRLRRVGVIVERAEKGLAVSSSRRLEPVQITTQPYPGFPTDLQAQAMALLCLADGNSMVTEKVFPDRFLHVGELNRMGAHLRKAGPTVMIEGVKRLVGAPVMASDLRASAALVLAGLIAKGTTQVRRIYHIDRGYENIERKLAAVGANIRRLQD